LDKIINLKKFWKNKRVFITGHTGFKGSWLIILLKLLGAKVFGYALKPDKKSLFNQIDGDKIIDGNYFGNINDLKILNSKINLFKPEIIFHLAAQSLVIDSYLDPLKTYKTNLMGTANILEAIRKKKFIKSVVIITTDKVYKPRKNIKKFSETDELGGYDPYSASKSCSEILLNSYIHCFFENSNLKNKVSSARSGNVIGGGDYSKNRLLPDIINSINFNKSLYIRNPNHVRPWQHVIEPIIGYLLLSQKLFEKKLNKYHGWNFGPENNNMISVIKLVNLIKKNYPLKIKLKKQRPFYESSVLRLNNSKSKKFLNWKPRWGMKQSLKKVLEWNFLYKRKISARKICEQQFINYFEK